MGILIGLEMTTWFLPTWVDRAPLDALAVEDWEEKNSADYDFILTYFGENNLAWTSNTKSKATLVSDFDVDESAVGSSKVRFIVNGNDKTKFSYEVKYDSPSVTSSTYTIKGGIASGGNTKSKDDDVKLDFSYKSSPNGDAFDSIGKYTYAGMGTITVSFEEKLVGTSNGDIDTFTQTNKVSYVDKATKTTLRASATMSGTYNTATDSLETLTSYGLDAGTLIETNDGGATITATWRKSQLSILDDSDIGYQAAAAFGAIDLVENVEFPIADLIETTKTFYFSVANTIRINSTIGQTAEVDGGAGNDTITGGAGDETIFGGQGVDILTGGRGSDTFAFSLGDSEIVSGKFDQIKDFSVSQGDKIALNGLGSISCHVRDRKELSFGAAQTDAEKDFADGGHNVSIQFGGNNALMFIDYDGDESADAFITLAGIRVGNAAFTNYAEGLDMFVPLA